MKSDVILIDNRGGGYREAVEETKRVADYRKLNLSDSLCLQLITEEMLSMLHSVAGEVKASFWLETENNVFTLNVTTQTVLDSEQRYLLISSSTSRKNEITQSFLGRLRDAFEEALTSEAERTTFELPDYISLSDLPSGSFETDEWDGYERSVLFKLADNIKIAIKGRQVTMTVRKQVSE